jgi:hypothetical protein
MKNKKRNLWPVLTLFFLAPAIGELLSGSAPPSEFFQPFGFLVMAAMYGSGAILIRELRVRWNKGWPTVFTLGAAYGIIEEGLGCKSFFNSQWGDLGPLAVYGRWAGVNWIWSLGLIIYHSVISIAIPILLVELMFPARHDERWLGRWGMIGFSFLLFADTLFCFAVLPYFPPVWTMLLTIAVIGALFFLARRLPTPPPPVSPGCVPRPLWFAIVGFAGIFIFFFIFWGFPELAVPLPLTVLITIGLIPLALWIVWKMSRSGAWTDEHQLALTGGALMFFVLLSPIQELDPARTDNTTGMIAVGLVTLIFLIWLWRRVKRQNPAAATPQIHIQGY